LEINKLDIYKNVFQIQVILSPPGHLNPSAALSVRPAFITGQQFFSFSSSLFPPAPVPSLFAVKVFEITYHRLLRNFVDYATK
jgi:hypothetical protein